MQNIIFFLNNIKEEMVVIRFDTNNEIVTRVDSKLAELLIKKVVVTMRGPSSLMKKLISFIRIPLLNVINKVVKESES